MIFIYTKLKNMTIFITVLVIILAVAGYVTYKIGTPSIENLKKATNQALDKIEPAIEEVKEVVSKVEATAPKITKTTKTTPKAKKTK